MNISYNIKQDCCEKINRKTDNICETKEKTLQFRKLFKIDLARCRTFAMALIILFLGKLVPNTF
jgi:hypothetical protein